MTLKDRIEDGYVLGLVSYQDTIMIYMAPSAWFVMNYPKYDPSILTSQERSTDFRNGVLMVDNSTVEAYLKAMRPDAISVNDLKGELPNNHEALQPIFLIDFNNQRYVSWFHDIDYEEYIPPDWEGIFDNPLTYLPDEIKQIWQ